MDWNEYRLTPATIVVTVGGIAALMLGFDALVKDQPLALPMLVTSGALLVAGAWIAPRRRWALRLGSWAATLAIPVWMVAWFALEGPSDVVSLASTAMIGASWWTSRFLREQLLPPEWARGDTPDLDPGPAAPSGWIEELPVGP